MKSHLGLPILEHLSLQSCSILFCFNYGDNWLNIFFREYRWCRAETLKMNTHKLLLVINYAHDREFVTQSFKTRENLRIFDILKFAKIR